MQDQDIAQQKSSGQQGPHRIVGLGELLWDLLPDGPQLGGAVSNFSVMASRLGDHATIASRIGNDQRGRDARSSLVNLPVDSSQLQIDAINPTSTVSVTIKNGQPHYIIHEPVAWDYLELTPAWIELAKSADAVCFGTLAQRNQASRHTIHAFLAQTRPGCMRLMDVNLREPYYSADILKSSLALATVLKMNDGEVPQVLELLGMPHTNEITDEAILTGARALLENFNLSLVCVTMGGNGSLLVSPTQIHRHPGIATKVVDTVGAGDTFTAALAHYYLQGASLAVMNEAGNRWGSWMASQRGAMPRLPDAQRDSITAAIEQIATETVSHS